MRKLGFIIITVFLALSTAVFQAPARASPLDSSFSAVYLAPDRVCNLTASRPPLPWNGALQTWWVVFDLKCLTFSGQYRASTPAALYVYTGCPTFGSNVVISDYSSGPPEFTSIRSGNAQSLQVVRSADYAAAANGIGPPQTWLRLAPLASPFPYSCSSGVFSKPRG